MSIYTFYPRRADGAANAFEAVELAGDAEARAHAQRVLNQYVSATEVSVWNGEQEVFTLARAASVAAE